MTYATTSGEWASAPRGSVPPLCPRERSTPARCQRRREGLSSEEREELRRAHPGLLGTFGFDTNGDITESPVTIMRVTRGGRSSKIGSTEGGVVDRIVRPSPSLVATESSTG